MEFVHYKCFIIIIIIIKFSSPINEIIYWIHACE